MAKKYARTTTLLDEVVDRIIEQVMMTGREDLAASVYLLGRLARVNRGLLKRERAALLDILEADDWLVEVGQAIHQHHQEQAAAMAERANATVQ
jgi:hypothetical protein